MTIKEIFNQTKNMGIGQKVKLVDMILTDLDKPDPLIEKAWIKEVSRRKTLMRTGRTRTRSYQQVMDKYL
ncbi:MAG: addiction module protein [Verrucomicrobiota bacterium]|nr:addiction module protein [Verrucomicrobiota bacterium]